MEKNRREKKFVLQGPEHWDTRLLVYCWSIVSRDLSKNGEKGWELVGKFAVFIKRGEK